MDKQMKRLVLIILLALSMTFVSHGLAFAEEAGRNWSDCMQLPSEEEIAKYNQTSTQRSPYLTGWFDTKSVGKFTEISVDFKADYLPKGTYCSIANFDLDYSALESKYERIEYNHVAGYAGFQRISEPERYNSILSFWDVFCYDSAGNVTTVQPKQLVPADQTPSQFDWEGNGTYSLRDYPWEAGKWYRALIQCGKSAETGNTTIEYWVEDLKSQSWTQLYVFDLSVPDVTFKGNVAVFLEDFDPGTSGDIRTMEVRNFRVRDVKGEWRAVESATFRKDFEYPGSYRYGSDGQTFWMITSGVPGLGSEEQDKILTVKNTEEGIPYPQ